MKWIDLVIWFVVCFAVAGLGGRWTTDEVKGWYRTLARPRIAPPSWVFGPVWTLLYALMATAAWLVWLSPASTARSVALALFLVQLALNLAWSWIFFRKHRMGAALAEIVLLWISIGATLLAFRQQAALAAWLIAPYWAWVSFATLLNAAYWRSNPEYT